MFVDCQIRSCLLGEGVVLPTDCPSEKATEIIYAGN